MDLHSTVSLRICWVRVEYLLGFVVSNSREYRCPVAFSRAVLLILLRPSAACEVLWFLERVNQWTRSSLIDRLKTVFDRHSEIPSRRKYFNVPETYSNSIDHSKIYWEDLQLTIIFWHISDWEKRDSHWDILFITAICFFFDVVNIQGYEIILIAKLRVAVFINKNVMIT